MRKIQLLLLSSLVFFSSCMLFGGKRVSGDGKIATSERQVGDFHSVQLSGSLNVHLKQDSDQAVKVEADENLMPLIEVFTEDGVLVVREKRGYNLQPSKEIVVYVTSPDYKAIRVSGSGNVFSDNEIATNTPLDVTVSGSGGIVMQLDAPKLSSQISGSGSLSLKGHATDVDLAISGSGSANCFDLVSDNVSISVSGSGDAKVTSNKKLDARVSGSGNVAYKGSPSINKTVSGSGQVTKAN